MIRILQKNYIFYLFLLVFISFTILLIPIRFVSAVPVCDRCSNTTLDCPDPIGDPGCGSACSPITCCVSGECIPPPAPAPGTKASPAPGTKVTTVEIPNPLGIGVTVNSLIANVIKAILGLVGVAALIMFIYGGIMWMTSAGNAERIRQGRETLVWASIGLIVIFSSYALVNLLLSAF